jgi:hypothetical protein
MGALGKFASDCQKKYWAHERGSKTFLFFFFGAMIQTPRPRLGDEGIFNGIKVKQTC